MQINSISNNFFNTKINNTNFGKQKNNIDKPNTKQTDMHPEDYETLNIYRKPVAIDNNKAPFSKYNDQLENIKKENPSDSH